MTKFLRSPIAWSLAVALVAIAVLGMYWFQPWKLVTDDVVDEALPTVASPSGPQSPSQSQSQSPSQGSAGTPAAPAANRVVATGTFISHEHDTSGTVEVVRLGDGRQQLVIRGLDTSNGPDLRVWLTDQRVVEGTAGWKVFDDGKWVEVAKLKGNKGDQVYDLPASADLDTLRSVTIWCKRFSVSFGAAELTAA